jgi:rod shape-determining protein MreB
MPALRLLLPNHVTWTSIGGVLLSLAAVLRTALAGWQYVERRRERSRIERSFGADYYSSEVIDGALRYYVRPYCTSVDPSQEAEIRQVVSTREDLFGAVERFLDKQSPYRHIFLLADSGMGKTSFVINYYAHNLRKRGRRRLAVVPLATPNALEDISRIEETKDTVIFLDAFDEDPKAMRDHRGRLEELMKVCSGFNRVLITCRTQFFASDEEIPRDTGVMIVAPRRLGESAIPEFWKLYISPLTDEQIAAYLRKRFPWVMWMKRRRAFSLITKIPLLTVRPMLLTYLPDVMGAGLRIEYAFQLYEVMVEKWLEREKGWIDPTQLREFSERLAIDLYTNREKRGAERLPADELSKLLPEFSSAPDALVIRRRSLLNRDALGNLKFAHRSIMEYLFVCRFITLPAEQRPNVGWTDLMKVFATEIVQACNAPKESSLEQLPLQMQFTDLSNTEIRIPSARKVCLDNAQLKKTNFARASLVGSSFKHADLREANFFGCDLTDVDFTGADLRDADLRSTARTGVVMTGALTSGALIDEERQPEPETRTKPGFSFGGANAGIDLGTKNTRIYIAGEGIVLNEPSIIAINNSTGRVEAAGHEAVALWSRHSNWTFSWPLDDGAIRDPDLALNMLRYFLAKVHYRTIARAVFAVPAGGTKANWHVLHNVARSAKVKKMSFLDNCLVAAVGASIPIEKAHGNMVVDLGGGTTDIAVISMGGIVYSRSMRLAGNEMDEAVMLYLKHKYNLLVGERIAEQIKIEIGSAYPLEKPLTLEVKGRNLIEGVPRTVTIDDSEIREALSECVAAILNAIRVALERTPPELSADLCDRGIVLMGGGALLQNLDKRIREETGLPVFIADDPFCSVVLGCGKLLSDWKLVEQIRLYPR